MNTESNVEEIGQKLAAELFASTVALITDTWRKEFEARTSLDLPQNAIDGMVLESVCFGRYYLERRMLGTYEKKQEEKIKQAIKDTLVFYLSDLYFESPKKENDPEGHRKGIEELFEEMYRGVASGYDANKGDDIIELFKARLQLIFSEGKYKIGFMDMTFVKKMQVKLALFLDAISGGNSLKDVVVFDVQLLGNLARGIAASVSEIEVRPA